jgi:hypothetical protein
MAFNNITPLQLGQAELTTAYTTLYTVPASPSTRTFVKDMDIINTTAATISVYVHLVPYGSAATTANALFYAVSIPPNTIMQWAGSQIINSNATIQIKASAVGCTITASGGEAI